MKNLSEILLKYQLDFVKSQKSRKLWISSRQIGKSFTLGFLAAYTALSKKNALVLMISTGSRAASELLKKVAQFAEAARILSKNAITYSASADKIEFSNGGRVLSLPSGNPQALRGYTSDMTIIDEACFIERPEEVMAAISPTLTRNPDAKLVMTSTPAGKNNYFYKMFTEPDDSVYVQTTTIHDAIKDGLKVDLEKLRQLCPDQDVFAQEYECSWLDSTGAMIDASLLDWASEFKSTAKYLGVDVGSTSDRSAFVSLAQSGDRLFIDDVVVMHKASYESQLDVLKQLHSKNKYSSGLIDATGIGSAFAEFATKKVSSRIRGLQFTASNKTPMYERLRSLIFEHKIIFSEKFKEILERDFRNVRRIVTEDGKVRYAAGRNEDGHSDIISAIVLALEAWHQMPGNATLPVAYKRYSAF